MHTKCNKKVDWAILAAALMTMGVLGVGALAGAATDRTFNFEDTSRLVSVQQLPEKIDACALDESGSPDANVASPEEESLLSVLREDPSPVLIASPQSQPTGQGARVPVRTIRDTAPTYSSIAVDVNSNEVDHDGQQFVVLYRVFDRLSPTPKNDTDVTPPKRIVTGDHTALQFNNGLYVDPVSGDIYSVESDTGDKMERFAREAQGDESPISILHTPHRVYNIAADEVKQELYLTVEFPPQIVVYPKHAKGEDKPLRSNRGRRHGAGCTARDRGGRERPPAVRQHLGASQRLHGGRHRQILSAWQSGFRA